MGQQNRKKWEYCSNVTKEHKISRKFAGCIEGLDTISKNEGCKNPPFSGEVGVNLDKVELMNAKKERRSRRRTVDAFIGLKNANDKKILLAEYKLNLKRPANLSKSEIVEKVNNTKNMVGSTVPIYSPIIFIFKDKQVQQGYNILRRYFPGKRKYQSLSISGFKKEYF